ncbi:MAG TPA: exodeoxyribonuclease V subunit gamma [Candidatus Binatia bacterium]|nr:exodeoxyribonuclease V subunit gamma [Candidatus Binatia bacterium]
MLTVVQGNRLETLADRLVDVLGASPAPPLVPEVVVVQNGGMARWLAMRIAARLGVCANVRFPLPAAFLWDVLRRLLPDVPAAPALEPAVVTWHLMALLEALPPDSVFAPLVDALGAGDERRRFEVARRLADVFDRYLVYRPDWILAWERGEETHWQAALWRRLVAREPGAHRARLSAKLTPAVAGAVGRVGLPARVALFGIPTLPPAELDAFARLAAHLDVHLFVLNPCREYWGDVVAERDLPRRAGRRDAAALHLAAGNPLLASFGRLGRDFIDAVQEYAAAEVDTFEEPGTGTLLQCLQSDVLHLRDRRDGADRPVLPPDDDSVQAHACHGPMREVEVLHDRLLALFAADPTLSPADVVVMTPDVERYAPCVEAVFATAPPERRIPFTVADVSLRSESPLVEAFLELLELPESRYEASRLLALIAVDAVRRRFGMAEGDVALAHRWVRASGVRWGVDAAARGALGLPAIGEHTWRFGLDRLLLGYTMAGEDQGGVGGVLPYDDIEGTAARALGPLATFAAAAFALRERLAAPRPPGEWAGALGALLDAFFTPEAEEDEDAAAAVRAALRALAESAERAGFTGPVSLALVRAELRRALDVPVRTGRFLAGSVTVCAMVPMRSIPFAVVCLLGMNDGAFPRSSRPPGFDRTADAPRRGDRNRRDDDRYLFLEALLSARRCLYLSWVGRDIRDNRRLPPSVAVSELLDYVEQAYGRELLVAHPLQAFSRRYFDGTQPELFSYAAERCAAIRRVAGAERAPAFVRRLPEAGEEWRTIDVERLARFLKHPVRYLLRERLGLRLEEAEGMIESREPFELAGLERWSLRSRLLAWRLAGNPLAAALPIVRGAGMLPHGRVGEVVFRHACEEIEDLAARAEAARAGAALPPLAVDLTLGPVRLAGTLGGVTEAGLVTVRLGPMRAKDRLDLWVRHLVLGCVAPAGVVPASRCVGESEDVTLAPAAAPATPLARLAALYWEGLHRPLPFFPESARAACRHGKDPLGAARRKFAEGERAEGNDAYVDLAFRSAPPLGREFLDLAHAVFDPLHASEGGEA